MILSALIRGFALVVASRRYDTIRIATCSRTGWPISIVSFLKLDRMVRDAQRPFAVNRTAKTLISFKQTVRSLTAGHFWLRYPTLAAYRALCAGTSSVTGLTTSGAAHAERSIEDAVHYIATVFNNYKVAAGVARFQGKIAEIGPGDSCGIGLMFLADGCDQVDLVDRFFSARDVRQQAVINRELVRRLPRLEPLLLDGNFSETSFKSLTRHYGESAAAETFFEAHRGYDFIVSCAVLEHVYDPLRAMKAAATALNHGGMMLHQIDCRDHGQFSTTFHELKFLELPQAMYAPLKWGGGPNRIRLSSYRKVLQEQQLKYTVYATSLAGVPELLPHDTEISRIPAPLLDISHRYISQVRGRLAKPFRDMSDEDLMITSFMIAAKKTNHTDSH